MSDWYEIDKPATAIELDDRGLQYGDGLFETIAIRRGKPRLWDYHYERLARGCRSLRLVVPAPKVIRARLDAALANSDCDPLFCIAKIIVTAGVTQRGYGRPLPTTPRIIVGAFPSAPVNRSAYAKGVATILCETRLAVGSPTAGLKTLNRLEQVLARSECLPTGAFEGLTLDAEGRLVCGTMSNVFIVRDNLIRTPSLERCGVDGTMRRYLFTLLEANDMECEVGTLTEADLNDADEVFLTNSQMGAIPVNRCGNLNWSVGPVTREVLTLLADNGVLECRT
ncbi:MAG: aminodeoxychorismate lyase [Woeseiaceae bacterium]|nr:aminodeoxychorismate lyase [Woeseiaceae bacterium]